MTTKGKSPTPPDPVMVLSTSEMVTCMTFDPKEANILFSGHQNGLIVAFSIFQENSFFFCPNGRQLTRMNSRSAIERMKSRNFYMVVALVIISTVSLWFLTSYPADSFRTIVSKTHHGIKNLPSNIHPKDTELIVDPIYLRQLGLSSLRPSGQSDGSSDGKKEAMTLPKQPVIVSAAKKGLFTEAAALMRSAQNLLPDYKLIMFDLGLAKEEKILLSKHCNFSTNCETRLFQFDKYPSHVAYLDIRSYRPICIQEMLLEHGALIWADDGYYFIERNLSKSLLRARDTGILAWQLIEPTSTFTHLKMFEYFNTEWKKYIFHHAVESSHLIIYSSHKMTKEVMLPWVKCALVEECINPPGAQSTGCVTFQKPRYMYRRCHKYDMSALNVVLGQVFKFNEVPYTAEQQLFGSLKADKLRAENRTSSGIDLPGAAGQPAS